MSSWHLASLKISTHFSAEASVHILLSARAAQDVCQLRAVTRFVRSCELNFLRECASVNRALSTVNLCSKLLLASEAQPSSHVAGHMSG